MEISSVLFGKTTSGQEVYRYSLRNKNSVKVDVINYGAGLVSVDVPDKTGKVDDIITGFDTLAEYEASPAYMGSTVGRVSGRIKDARFTLDGTTYELSHNNGPNSVHGGTEGFHRRVWSSQVDGPVLRLQYTSADGEEGYPGELTVNLTYQLTEDNELVMDYTATTTKPTPISLLNHGMFNLAGHKHSDIYDHTMMINAEKFTPTDKPNDFYGLPNGEIASVEGTNFDMRKPVLLRTLVADLPGDANYCLPGGRKMLAARVEHEASGRVMEIYTDQPSLQMYNGWAMTANTPGKQGAVYNKYCCFLFSGVGYTDAVNKPNFPSCILRPGETYRHTTSYKFTIKQ